MVFEPPRGCDRWDLAGCGDRSEFVQEDKLAAAGGFCERFLAEALRLIAAPDIIVLVKLAERRRPS